MTKPADDEKVTIGYTEQWSLPQRYRWDPMGAVNHLQALKEIERGTPEKYGLTDQEYARRYLALVDEMDRYRGILTEDLPTAHLAQPPVLTNITIPSVMLAKNLPWWHWRRLFLR